MTTAGKCYQSALKVVHGYCLLVGLSIGMGQNALAQSAESKPKPISEAQAAEHLEAVMAEIRASGEGQDSAVEELRCIDKQLIRETKVLGGRHVVIRTGRDKYYLVQFKHRCPTLRRHSSVSIESRGQRLCRLDTLRPIQIQFGQAEPGPMCQIPGFQPVTREQIAQLKEALKQ